ncbi:MAG: mandelate racemase/muconate lactonizing enzyme family protein [Rhizobiaceae bacterium]|nr:mandelate racemase/muconate lactonizing enzyme family protein [Rhizobiaceae bacterium]
MKIRSIRATPVNIPFRAPYRFSYGSIGSLTKTIIELETEDGVVGLGECADGDQSAAVARVADRLVGHDIRAINGARRLLVPGMQYTPWDNIVSARRVFGGIEMAMWDARGKSEGLAIADMLGGPVRTDIPLTEYFSYRLPGGDDPGEASPADVARYCARMIERHGSMIFEGKVGTVGLDEEVRMVREVRAAIGDRSLQLDANGVYTLPTAREALRRFQPFDIAWFEEPCERYEDMAALRAVVPCSFSSHVVDLPKAVRLGAPDAIVTNINEHGGIKGTVEFIAACAAMDVGFRFHSGETGVASAAYLQVTAATEHVRGASQTLFHWYADDVIEGGPLPLENGVTPLPDGPGLGVVLDRKALRRCHERYLSEGRFPSGAVARAADGYGKAFRKL